MKHFNEQQLWQFGSPQCEARWMYNACVATGKDFAGFRKTIAVSEFDEYLLRRMCHGAVALARLEGILAFRQSVLEEFDRLVREGAAVRPPASRPSRFAGLDVPSIKALYATGLTQQQIARRVGVSPTTVSVLLRRQD